MFFLQYSHLEYYIGGIFGLAGIKIPYFASGSAVDGCDDGSCLESSPI